MSFRFVPRSVTLNDLERRNDPYFALFFYRILVISGAYCVKVVDKAITVDNMYDYYRMSSSKCLHRDCATLTI